MIEVRRPKASEIAAVLVMACREAKEKYPRLRFNGDKSRELATRLIADAACFCRVAVRQGEIVGAMAVSVQDNAWADRKAANIVLWVSEYPGAGMKMLREFCEWFKSRRIIRVAGMSPEFEFPERLNRALEREGFARNGGSFVMYNE